MAVAVVGSAFVIIATAVTVVRASVIMAVIVAACWVIGPRSPTDFFFMSLFGLFSIGVLVGHLEHLTDRCQWLPVELPMELIMMIEPLDKIGDYFGFNDVRNMIPYF